LSPVKIGAAARQLGDVRLDPSRVNDALWPRTLSYPSRAFVSTHLIERRISLKEVFSLKRRREAAWRHEHPEAFFYER
jgi:hypothetical protein